MKVLIATTHRGIVGGVETYHRAILPMLSRLGWRIALLYEQEAVGTNTIDEEVQWEKTLRLIPTNQASVMAATRDWGPNVIYNNGLTNIDFERELSHFPVIYFAHNYYGTCISGAKSHGWPTPSPCGRTLGAGCLVHYFPRRCGGLNPITMLQQYRMNKQRLAMLRGCARIQVASEAMRTEYLRHGFCEAKVVLNPLFPANAVRDDTMPVARPMSGTVLLAGRLTKLKGGDFLIRAMHLAKKAGVQHPLHLAVAGDGPELARLQSLAESLGVPATFYGWIDGTKLESLLRSVDLLAMPSLWPEPFGLLGVEAGCYGVPSVGFAHGGITDWLIDGISGMRAPSPPTVAGLADAIGRALGNADLHHNLRVGAWETAKRFNAESHIRRLCELLQAAGREGGSARR